MEKDCRECVWFERCAYVRDAEDCANYELASWVQIEQSCQKCQSTISFERANQIEKTRVAKRPTNKEVLKVKVKVYLEYYGDVYDFAWEIIELFRDYGMNATELPNEQWKRFFDRFVMLLKKELYMIEVVG